MQGGSGARPFLISHAFGDVQFLALVAAGLHHEVLDWSDWASEASVVGRLSVRQGRASSDLAVSPLLSVRLNRPRHVETRFIGLSETFEGANVVLADSWPRVFDFGAEA